MKNNYPIKYAAMPIMGYVAWQREGAILYIASKCFQIKETTEYFRNGDTETSYSVLFPYKKVVDNNTSMTWERIEPSLENEQEIITVRNVYNTIEEAEQEAVRNNKILLEQKLRNIYTTVENFQQERKKVEKKLQQQIDFFKNLEQEIEEKTKDLTIGLPPKLQNVIVIDNSGIKEYELSLYEYSWLVDRKPFTVFHISEESYQNLSKKIAEYKEIEAEDIIEKEPILIYDSEKKLMQLRNPNGEGNEGFLYLRSHRGQKYMYYEENQELTLEDVASHPDEKKIFTMETYEDIVASYLPYFIFPEKKSTEAKKIYCKTLVNPDITLAKPKKKGE